LGYARRGMIRVRAAGFLLLAALIGLGCGGDDESTDQFRDGYNAAIERLNEVNTNLEESGDELASQPGSRIAREFERIAGAAARTRAELAELAPPEEARDEFDQLLAAIRGGVENIREVADAAREGNQDRFREATEALEESSEEISRAEAELKDAVESD
jgi:methyl-accepting chemotaxis protein